MKSFQSNGHNLISNTITGVDFVVQDEVMHGNYAGVGVGFNFSVNAMAGPVPLTATFELGGAIQLDFRTAVRYGPAGREYRTCLERSHSHGSE